MSFSALILAGGQSKRMGRDKAWLETGGQPLLARQIALARESGAREVFVSGRPGRDYSAFGCPVLLDQFPDAGPLAGIERGLDATSSPLLLVLAVDLPGLKVELLQRLSAQCRDEQGAIPRIAGRLEPLAAFYPRIAHPLAISLLKERSVAVRSFATLCVQSGLATFADLPGAAETAFTNWNVPGDVRPVVSGPDR